MLGRICVGRVDGLVEAVGQDDGRLASGQRRVDALGVFGARHAVVQGLLNLLGDLGGIGEQHGAGELVMLGLTDQVGGQQARVGGLVGDDADLGGAGDRVDAHERGDERLGGGHEDVARAGDLVDRVAQHVSVLRLGALGSVCEHGDGLGATDRVDLVDAEDGAGGEDGLVGQSFRVVACGRSGDGQRLDASGLRRHGVHDHGRRVDSLAAGHVQTDALDRNPTLGDAGAFGQIGVKVLRHLVGGDGACATHGLLDGGAYFGIKRLKCRGHRLDRHAQVLGTHMIELLLEVSQGRGAAFLDVVKNRPHQIGGFGSAHRGARHRGK